MKLESRPLCTKVNETEVPHQIKQLDDVVKKLRSDKKRLKKEVSLRLKSIDMELNVIQDQKKKFYNFKMLERTIQDHNQSKKMADEIKYLYTEPSKYNELLDHKINNLKFRDKFNRKLQPLGSKSMLLDISHQDIDMAENKKYIKQDHVNENCKLERPTSNMICRDIEEKILFKTAPGSPRSKGRRKRKKISNKIGSEQI